MLRLFLHLIGLANLAVGVSSPAFDAPSENCRPVQASTRGPRESYPPREVYFQGISRRFRSTSHADRGRFGCESGTCGERTLIGRSPVRALALCCTTGLPFALAGAAVSQNPGAAIDPGESSNSAERTIALGPESFSVEAWKSRDLQFRLPTALAPGKTVLLHFDAREWGEGLKPGELNEYLRLTVNGRDARESKDRLNSYLCNKRARLQLANGQKVAWFQTIWLLAQAPEFSEDLEGRLGPQPFHFVVDIGHLVKPGTNTVAFYAWPFVGRTMFVRRVRLSISDAPAHHQGFSLAPGDAAETVRGRDGSMVVRYGPRAFPVSSSFSIPGGGWNRLGPPVAPRKGEVQANVQTSAQPGNVLTARFADREYQVRRDISSSPNSPNMLLVRDTITNTSGRDIGMMVRHEIPFPAPLAAVHLGGNPNPSITNTWAPWNPTVVVPLGPLVLGLVARDDGFRAQAEMSYFDGLDPSLCPPGASCNTPFVSLRTDQLAIPAGGRYTLEWSLYTLPRGDYYTVINQVRRDWGVGMTIDGPYWWGFRPEWILKMSDEELRSFHARNRPFAFIMDGEWVDRLKPKTPQGTLRIGAGLGVGDPYFADLRQRLVEARKKVQRVLPGVKYGVYNHMYNNTQDNPSAFPDSRILKSDGQRQTYNGAGYMSLAYGTFPTLTNQYGQAYRRMIQDQRKEIGNDAVYFDETEVPSPSHRGLNYGCWDGKTAILNSDTFEIIQKAGYTFLLSGPFLQTVVADLRKSGVWVLGNGQPSSLFGNRQTWPRFTEMQKQVERGYEGHLYSNIAYGTGGIYSVQTLRDDLDLGMIYAMTAPDDKLGITKHFFPITVEFLSSGIVYGKERIITDRAGDFGWDKVSYSGRVWLFDADGKPVDSAPEWKLIEGKTAVAVPEGGIGILERKL